MLYRLLAQLKKIQQKKILWLSLSSIIILFVFLSFVSGYFTQRKIVLINNEYLKEDILYKTIGKQYTSLWQLNQQELIKKLTMNPFVESVSIQMKYFVTLIIELKLSSLIGQIHTYNKPTYLTDKGLMITGDFIKKDYTLPNIILYKGIKKEVLYFFAQQLGVFKLSHIHFFKKIRKIDLLNKENISIFIIQDGTEILKEYRFRSIPTLQDWIKIQILDERYEQGNVILMNTDSVIVQN